MFGYRNKIKELKEHYEKLSDAELDLEKDRLCETLKVSYGMDFKHFKSHNYRFVVYKDKSQFIQELIKSLEYRCVVKKNRIFVLLQDDYTEDEYEDSIKHFLWLRKKYAIFNSLSFVSCIMTLLAILYGIIHNVSESASVLSFTLCMISVLFSLVAKLCLKDSKKIGVIGF